jgi:hypothetical protein
MAPMSNVAVVDDVSALSWTNSLQLRVSSVISMSALSAVLAATVGR